MIWGEAAVLEPVQGAVGVIEGEEHKKVDWCEREEGEGDGEVAKMEVYSNLKILQY